MTIRNYWGRTIPARWFSPIALLCCVLPLVLLAGPVYAAKRRPAVRPPVRPAAPGRTDLVGLVRTYRSAPTPTHRAAVESYAAAHPNEAPLARLALGVVAYEQKDFENAVATLQKLSGKLPRIADYSAYYLAAARVEAADYATVAKDLAPVRAADVVSPLAARSWILEARALKASQPADAARLLRDHYAALPQPDGDIALADCYQAANDLANAAEFYQRVYYQFTSGDASTRAAAAIVTLKVAMGASYPQPLLRQLLGRADRFFELHDYTHARAEYRMLLDRPGGQERDQARVRIGAADYATGKGALAVPYLLSLELTDPAADAERLYWLEECARQRKDDEDMMAHVKQLAEKYRQSPWRLKALISAANRFLLANRPDQYVPLYKAAYEDFPNDTATATCHWKVTFEAYLHGKSDASSLLREHLERFPAHATAGGALYFLGRLSEQQHDYASARACYQRLAKAFQNYYYGVLAGDRLRAAEISSVAASQKMADFLAAVKLPVAVPVPTDPTRTTILRIERSRLLRNAGLADLADSELRFGARTDGQGALLGIESASSAEAANVAMRIMKSLAPDYLTLPLDAAPRKFWELLYPLPYRAELTADAQQQALDPFLVAGLIRQESEFNAEAVSRANAYGFMQVRPGTGRQFARRAGVQRFTTQSLFQPAVNLKIGTSILKSMLDENGGRVEQTLAAYNAGPARAAEWLTWNRYREPAEFVESIPFTETRDYVQAVIRNAGIYRRLYQ